MPEREDHHTPEETYDPEHLVFYSGWLNEALRGDLAAAGAAGSVVAAFEHLVEQPLFAKACQYEGFDISGLRAVYDAAKQHRLAMIEDAASDLQTHIFDHQLFARVSIVSHFKEYEVQGVVAGDDRVLPIVDGVVFIHPVDNVTIQTHRLAH